MQTVTITGMRCGHCVGAVTEALNKIAGVSNVSVDLEKQRATFEATPAVSMDTVRNAIKAIGFEAE
ncbi:MAG: heavy-metal-associated domain-containing protein [Thermodesulfobacteriota bacterium]